MAKYYLQNSGQSISLLPPFAKGGEGKICPVDGYPELLVKRFIKPKPDIEDKLAAMLIAPPPCLTLGGGYANAIRQSRAAAFREQMAAIIDRRRKRPEIPPKSIAVVSQSGMAAEIDRAKFSLYRQLDYQTGIPFRQVAGIVVAS